ncbi:MAG: transglycosylase SLT domain-containing protein [Bacillota bacterium]
MKIRQFNTVLISLVIVLTLITGSMAFFLYTIQIRLQAAQERLNVLSRLITEGGEDVDSLKAQMELFDTKLQEIQSLNEKIQKIEEVYDQAERIKKHIDEKRRKIGLKPLPREHLNELVYNMDYQSRVYGVDVNLISSICYVESQYNVKAVGKKGERGLMQVMPGTFRILKTGDFRDWRDTLEAGVKHFSGLLDFFHGNVEKAITAYNVGTNRSLREMMRIGRSYTKRVSRCYRGLRDQERSEKPPQKDT